MLTVTPNPIPADVNVATVTWSGVPTAQVRANGTLFAAGAFGTAKTGPWAFPGLVFTLVDSKNPSMILESVTMLAPKPVKPPTWIPAPPVGAAVIGPKSRSVSSIPPGVLGDGKTDDTAAINSCLRDYSTIRFPAGDYLISGPLNVVNSGSIQGEGAGLVRFMVIPGSSISVMWNVTAPHVRFAGFTCDGNIQNAGMSWGIAPWQPNTAYYANPGGPGGTWYGGGADCVYFQGAIFRCLKNHVSTSDSEPMLPPFAWQPIGPFLTSQQLANMQPGILFAVGSSGDVRWRDVEMTGSQFGIFLYTGQRYYIQDCYAHDFGVEWTGNNSTMDAVHSQPGVEGVWQINNDFQNIYVPKGPGATSATFHCASNLISYGNRAVNCYNRGGGSLIGSGAASPGNVPANWIVALNMALATTPGDWPQDYSGATEVEAAPAVIVGNIGSGFVGGHSVSNLPGSDAGPYAIAANVALGVGSSLPGSVGIGVVAEDGVTHDVTIQSNVVCDYATGIEAWPGTENVQVGTQLIARCPVPVNNQSKTQ